MRTRKWNERREKWRFVGSSLVGTFRAGREERTRLQIQGVGLECEAYRLGEQQFRFCDFIAPVVLESCS